MRRKRRVRNQIISYIVAVLILAGIVTGGVMGIRSIASAMEEKKAAEESQAQAESLAQEEAMMQSQTENETGEAQTETPVENVPSKEELLEELVESCVANMSLEDKVAGLFIVTPEQLTGVTKAVQAGSGTEEALKKYPVGGLVYFAQRCIRTRASDAQLLQRLYKGRLRVVRRWLCKMLLAVKLFFCQNRMFIQSF